MKKKVVSIKQYAYKKKLKSKLKLFDQIDFQRTFDNVGSFIHFLQETIRDLKGV